MNLYREHILDHWRNPRNHGRLPQADVTIDESNPHCGDTLHLELKVVDNRITAVAFEGEGCAISIAAASMLTEQLVGKPLAESEKITDRQMLDTLGVPVSPTRMTCALLALSGLRRGLATVN